MTVSENEVRHLMGKLSAGLKRLAPHREMDDLVGEAYLGLATALHLLERQEVRNVHGFCLRIAWRQVQEYLRSPANWSRTKTKQGTPAPLAFVPISAFPEDWLENTCVGPDDTAAVVEALAVEQVLDSLSEEQAQVIRLRYEEGLTIVKTARRLRMGEKRLRRIVREVRDGLSAGLERPPTGAHQAQR